MLRDVSAIDPRTDPRTAPPTDRWADHTTPSDVPREAQDLVALVGAARRADSAAWDELHRRFTPMLRAQGFLLRLDASTIDDVVQTTWEKCVVYLDRIKTPEALPGWLKAVCRHEGLHHLRRGLRSVSVTEVSLEGALERHAPQSAPEPWEDMVEEETHRELRAAIELLPARQRQLIRRLLDPPAGAHDYAAISRELQMPMGSIGPTRQRAVARLRKELAPALAS